MNQKLVAKKNLIAGISIIETIVALAILGIIGAALLTLNVQIQSATNSSRFKSQAESYAQQMIEQVRNEKNKRGGIAKLLNSCYTDGKLTGPAFGICTCTSESGISDGQNLDPDGNFKGYVLITGDTPATYRKAQATVYWKEKNLHNCLTVETFFYDY